MSAVLRKTRCGPGDLSRSWGLAVLEHIVVMLSVAWRPLVLVLLLVTTPFAAAQWPAKPTRIGVLTLGFAMSAMPVESFRQALREHGHVEGGNTILEFRFADGQTDKLPALAAELVDLDVDVIVTESNVAALAAKQATRTIPIVMALSGDPVKAGVVNSLARPGANITGLTLIHPELSAKRLELLSTTIPRLSLVAVLWNPTNPAAADFLRETERAARSLGLRVVAVEVRSPAELDAAFKATLAARPGALITLGDGMLWGVRTRIVEFAARSQLPGIYPQNEYAEAGGLMSYGPSVDASFRRAAALVDKVLKGAKPAEMPVEQPTKFELVINLRTARALGLTMPHALLLRADEVIR